MVLATARTTVKSRLDIDSTVTTFDSLIDGFVNDAVNRLFPKAMQDAGQYNQVVVIDSQTGQGIVSLTASTFDTYRSIEALGSDGVPFPVRDTMQFGTNVRVRGLSSSVSTPVIYGLKRYTLTTVPLELERAIYYYAMSDFYSFLVGNKRYYNAYMSNGRGEVESMDEIAAGLESKADAIVEEKSTYYGR